MTVIGDIVGIPESDRPEVFETLDRILKLGTAEVQVAEEQAELFGKIFGYGFELIAEKPRNPVDDIWSALATAVVTDETGDELSLPTNELELFFFVLALAGSDTTKNALAIGLQAFVANPEQIERYRDEEGVRATAAEEVLRWSTPVAFWTGGRSSTWTSKGPFFPKATGSGWPER